MSPKQMLVSIIIPVYNEELTVGNVIERVQATTSQMGLNNEIIVVDDHSFDKSLQVARTYPVRLYSLKSHVGKGMGLRAGFAKPRAT
jgi:glycosyltransferase involved in cell wall biosynthesis